MTQRVELAPDSVEVRAPCDLELVVRPDRRLTAGDEVAWQLPHSWTALRNGPTYTKEFQTTDPAGEHYVDVAAPGSDAAFETSVERRHLPDDTVTRHGRRFVGTLAEGAVPAGDPVRIRCANTNAPYLAGEESAWVRVAGEAPEADPTLTVTPGDAAEVRVVAPSVVRPGERFRVLVVSLDAYGNRSEAAYDGDLLLDDGTVVVRDLSFVGSVRVPTALADEGVHRFAFADALSNPVRVSPDASRVRWGDTHVHTGLSHDGQGSAPYRYARDVSGLDFAAVTDHVESLGAAGDRRIQDWATAANDPGRFVTLPAFEVALPEEYGGAHYNFYFRSVEAFRDMRDRDGVAAVTEGPDPGAPAPSEMLFFPHHTGINGYPCDITDLAAPEYCPAVEVYSHHGQSEYYAPQHVLGYEFNRLRKPERRVNNSVRGPHYVQDFWEQGHRLAAVGSSDDHCAQPGRRHNGVVGVRTDDLSREGVFDGLRARNCYGTTGERILLDFSVGGTRMGGVRTAGEGETLEASLEVHGTDLLVTVEVLRHRFDEDDGFVPVLSDVPDAQPAVADDADLATTPNAGQFQRAETMDASYSLELTADADCLYYARVTQGPLERPAMAWSSPVWVDLD
jgi:hypothetical protein